MALGFMKWLSSKEKISEDEKFNELIPKSTLEEFDSIRSEFRAKEIISDQSHRIGS